MYNKKISTFYRIEQAIQSPVGYSNSPMKPYLLMNKINSMNLSSYFEIKNLMQLREILQKRLKMNLNHSLTKIFKLPMKEITLRVISKESIPKLVPMVCNGILNLRTPFVIQIPAFTMLKNILWKILAPFVFLPPVVFTMPHHNQGEVFAHFQVKQFQLSNFMKTKL